MNLFKWTFGIFSSVCLCACGPNFDSIAGEQKRLDMENIKSMSLKRAPTSKTSADSPAACEADLSIRYDASIGQFKFSECDGARGTTTHVFSITSLLKKSLEAELLTLTFKKFTVPLTGVCLRNTDGDSGVIELKGNGNGDDSQLLVPSQALLLNSGCDDPVVVNGIFDGSAMTKIIKIMHLAVKKS